MLFDTEMEIREMTKTDWSSVKSIYESGILTGIATFEVKAPKWENWDEAHLPFGRLVATIKNTIVGWIALSPISNRYAYRGVAEISVYISPEYRKRGIGEQLLLKEILISEQNNIWTLQASMFRENHKSFRLHQKMGFRTIGHRERIGYLNGKWRDNIILERRSKKIGIC